MMRKQYTAAFKARVVQELLKEEKTLAQLASEYEVHPTQLKSWRAVALEGLPGLFEKQEKTADLPARSTSDCYRLLKSKSAWMGKGELWTIFLRSGCGAR